jgi:hypothetical protein
MPMNKTCPRGGATLAIKVAKDTSTTHTPHSPIIIIHFPISKKQNIQIPEWL